MGQEFDGYDRWKAQEPRPDEDTCCHECGEERCKCEPDEVLDLAPEAITDEQVAELVAELREKRVIVARVEGVLAGLEQRQRDERPHVDQLDDEPAYPTGIAHGHVDELENVVALLRAALGTAI